MFCVQFCSPQKYRYDLRKTELSVYKNDIVIIVRKEVCERILFQKTKILLNKIDSKEKRKNGGKKRILLS
jgi:hypothetical protein